MLVREITIVNVLKYVTKLTETQPRNLLWALRNLVTT